MTVERSTDGAALRKYKAFDLEAAMTAAQAAATEAFSDGGMPDPKVVVNVNWRAPDGHDFVAGSGVPPKTSTFIAESLRASADEVEEAAGATNQAEGPNG